jgi:hypothetical protein
MGQQRRRHLEAAAVGDGPPAQELQQSRILVSVEPGNALGGNMLVT